MTTASDLLTMRTILQINRCLLEDTVSKVQENKAKRASVPLTAELFLLLRDEPPKCHPSAKVC